MIDYSITHARPRFTVYEDAFVIDPILIIESSLADVFDWLYEKVFMVLVVIGLIPLLSLFMIVILFDLMNSVMSPRGYL